MPNAVPRRVVEERIVGHASDMTVDVAVQGAARRVAHRAGRVDARVHERVHVRGVVRVIRVIVAVMLVRRVRVLVHHRDRRRSAELRPHPPACLPDCREQQHPAAAHAERVPVTHEHVEDVQREGDERGSDDAFHRHVDGSRQPRREHDGAEAEHEHDERMAEGLQRREQHGTAGDGPASS